MSDVSSQSKCQMSVKSSFAHPLVTPNLYDFIYFLRNKEFPTLFNKLICMIFPVTSDLLDKH